MTNNYIQLLIARKLLKNICHVASTVKVMRKNGKFWKETCIEIYHLLQSLNTFSGTIIAGPTISLGKKTDIRILKVKLISYFTAIEFQEW